VQASAPTDAKAIAPAAAHVTTDFARKANCGIARLLLSLVLEAPSHPLFVFVPHLCDEFTFTFAALITGAQRAILPWMRARNSAGVEPTR
jgi:hypothetical protein